MSILLNFNTFWDGFSVIKTRFIVLGAPVTIPRILNLPQAGMLKWRLFTMANSNKELRKLLEGLTETVSPDDVLLAWLKADIGAAIMEKRNSLGMGQKEFAGFIGVSLYISPQIGHPHGQNRPPSRRNSATPTETRPIRAEHA